MSAQKSNPLPDYRAYGGHPGDKQRLHQLAFTVAPMGVRQECATLISAAGGQKQSISIGVFGVFQLILLHEKKKKHKKKTNCLMAKTPSYTIFFGSKPPIFPLDKSTMNEFSVQKRMSACRFRGVICLPRPYTLAYLLSSPLPRGI